MNLDDALYLASESELSEEQINVLCAEENISLPELCNQLALRTAKRFVADEITFDFGDSVMNFLFGIMTDALVKSKVKDMPEPAWGIYLAFDRGEYHNSSFDAPDEDMSEKYTKPELVRILNQEASHANKQ